MNLREYLFYKEMSMEEFSKTADLSSSYVSQLLRGKLNPTAKTLRVIERATGGKVKAENVCAPTKLPSELESEEEEEGKAA